jgi:hypothetical protein
MWKELDKTTDEAIGLYTEKDIENALVTSLRSVEKLFEKKDGHLQ